MGFDINMTNRLLFNINILSLEQAIDFLVKRENKWTHPFVNYEIDNENISKQCIICEDPINLHMDFNNYSASENFQKLLINSNRNSYVDDLKPKKNKITVDSTLQYDFTSNFSKIFYLK